MLNLQKRAVRFLIVRENKNSASATNPETGCNQWLFSVSNQNSVYEMSKMCKKKKREKKKLQMSCSCPTNNDQQTMLSFHSK